MYLLQKIKTKKYGHEYVYFFVFKYKKVYFIGFIVYLSCYFFCFTVFFLKNIKYYIEYWLYFSYNEKVVHDMKLNYKINKFKIYDNDKFWSVKIENAFIIRGISFY